MRRHPPRSPRWSFLPTPSARRATVPGGVAGLDEDDFYPRPPRGGRPVESERIAVAHLFLPTPSARRATPERGRYLTGRHISTHALREEGDIILPVKDYEFIDFYPRPPRGGRLQPG